MKGTFCAYVCVCGEYLKQEIVIWRTIERNWWVNKFYGFFRKSWEKSSEKFCQNLLIQFFGFCSVYVLLSNFFILLSLLLNFPKKFKKIFPKQFPTLSNFSSFHLFNMEMKLRFTHFMWLRLKIYFLLCLYSFIFLVAISNIFLKKTTSISLKEEESQPRSHAEMSFV